MIYLTVILKLILCVVGFLTAFFGIFRKTIDDQKCLTKHGKMCIACVFVTFSIGVSNELLNLYKEEQSSIEKKAANAHAQVTQGKLDQALEDGRKRGEEAQTYRTEASDARKELAAMQKKLEEIDSHTSDPTVKRLINDIKRGIGTDSNMTIERFDALSKIVNDIHGDLVEVKSFIIDEREMSRDIHYDISALRTTTETLCSEIRVHNVKPVVDASVVDSLIEASDGINDVQLD